jgi:hypothetical protein
VKSNYDDQENFGSPDVGRTENRIPVYNKHVDLRVKYKIFLQVAEKEQSGDAESDANEDIVEDCDRLVNALTRSTDWHTGDWRPGYQCHGDPNEVGISVQCPAFKQVC